MSSIATPKGKMWVTTEDGDPITATSQPKQTSAAPSSAAAASATGTAFTLAAGERGFIQNLGTTPLAVKLGAGASNTSFNMILQAGAAASDGKGGFANIESFIGAVSVAPMSGSASYIAWKQTI